MVHEGIGLSVCETVHLAVRERLILETQEDSVFVPASPVLDQLANHARLFRHLWSPHYETFIQ
jgi:hypothetical protein